MKKFKINHFLQCDCCMCPVVKADIITPGNDENPDCGCDCAGPFYDERACNKCPWNFACHVVERPDLYPSHISE